MDLPLYCMSGEKTDVGYDNRFTITTAITVGIKSYLTL